MPKPKLSAKEILLPALSLFLICFVMAGALAVVNEITKNKHSEENTIYQEIFPEARFVDRGEYYTAYDQNDTFLGYCIDAEAQGYGGAIQVAVGLDAQGGILTVRVVSCEGETPGLGTRIQDGSFLSQFIGGAGDVDAITGATYSSLGVMDAVKQALMIYEEVIAP